jgi:ATP-binding cassette, subfamily C (CFTR/MRP), member 4
MVHPPAAEGHPPNPLKYASLYSQLTFSWPLPLIRKGVAKEIQEDDIPDIMPDEDSDRNRCRIEAAWNEEKELAQKHGRAASLHRALLKLYFRTLWYVQPAIAMTSASRIGQAVTLGSLMDFFQDRIENQTKWEGYILVLILVFCASVPLLTHHQTYFRAWRMG